MPPKEAFVKRLALAFAVLSLLFVACQPTLEIQNNVLPTLYSVTVPAERSGTVLLQGRYFGDGADGAAENSYVILGADVSGQGGVRVRANSWSPSRIEVPIPEGAGSGFVFVVVRGQRSNGLSANLP
jgi:hypothetical protein